MKKFLILLGILIAVYSIWSVLFRPNEPDIYKTRQQDDDNSFEQTESSYQPFTNEESNEESVDLNNPDIKVQKVPEGVLPEGSSSTYLEVKSAGFAASTHNVPQTGLPALSYALTIAHTYKLSELKDPMLVIKYQNPSGGESSTRVKPDEVKGETTFISPAIIGFKNQSYYQVKIEIEDNGKVVDSLSQDIYLNLDPSVFDKYR